MARKTHNKTSRWLAAGAMALAVASMAAPIEAQDHHDRRGGDQPRQGGGQQAGGQNRGPQGGGFQGGQRGGDRQAPPQAAQQRPQMNAGPRGGADGGPRGGAPGNFANGGPGARPGGFSGARPDGGQANRPSSGDRRGPGGPGGTPNFARGDRGPDGRGPDRNDRDRNDRDRNGPNRPGGPDFSRQDRPGSPGFNNRGPSRPGFAGRDDRRGGNAWSRDWRRDNRYDWQSYRSRNRQVYHLGQYYAPYRSYSYRRVGIGFTLGALFYGQRYWIDDPAYYRLPPAYPPYRWVRYYDDALLVDVYSGEVIDTIYDFFW